MNDSDDTSFWAGDRYFNTVDSLVQPENPEIKKITKKELAFMNQFFDFDLAELGTVTVSIVFDVNKQDRAG